MAKSKSKPKPKSKPSGKDLPGPPITKDLWGAIDRGGNVVIAPELEFVGAFSGGLALAKKGGLYGFVDPSGTFAIAPAFDLARAFSGEIAAIRVSGKWGFVSRDGRVAVQPEFDEVRDASGGVAFARAGGKWALVAADGKTLVTPMFDEAFDWVGGRAVVSKDGLYGAIDASGKPVVAIRRHGLYPFVEGLAAFAMDGRWGYLREDGGVAIEPAFDGADPFSEGVARAFEDGAFGYIDTGGRWVVTPELPDVNVRFGETDASRCRGGRIVFLAERGGVTGGFGFLDKAGNVVVPPRFDDLRPLAGGFARIRREGWFGFVDAAGEIAVEPQYADASDFAEGVARVCGTSAEQRRRGGEVSRGTGWGLVDGTGAVVLALDHEEIDVFADGLARVKRGGKWGYVDSGGKTVIAPAFEMAASFAEGFAAVRRRVGDEAATTAAIATTESLLAPLIAAAKPTEKPFLRLAVKPVEDVSFGDAAWPSAEKKAFGQAGLLRSKLGGIPYVPAGGEIPRVKKQPMMLLAQINFAEMPALEGFPRRGLLQLFVEDDPSLGAGSKDLTKQGSFRVLFHEVPVTDKAMGERHAAAISLLEGTSTNLPFPCLAHLSGALDRAPVSIYDHSFASLVDDSARERLSDERVSKAYEDLSKAGGHKIGGWPLFTQDDPRAARKYSAFDTLLLQLDSDGFVEIQDAGVASLFVESDALAELDFSRVLWTTDSL